MLTDIKNLFLRSFFSRNYIRALWGLYTTRRWEKSNRQGSPPHAIKERIVRDCARRFGAHTMIETGTLHGDMVYSVRNAFARIYTIELSETFFARARRRLAPYPNVTVLQGDSGKVLPELLVNTLEDRCLFWLDAHYSGEYAGEMTAKADQLTPIVRELAPVLNHAIRDHVILIDDARLFDGNGYPTFEQLRHYILGIRPDLAVEVSDDIIRIHTPSR